MRRLHTTAGSVALVALVNVGALAATPPGSGTWLTMFAVLAVAAAIQSALWDASDLVLALLFSIPPVAALAAYPGRAWLIAPLAAALLVAGELNSLGWELRGMRATDATGRVRGIVRLGLTSFGAALVVAGVAARPLPLGPAAALAGAMAFIALAGVHLRRPASPGDAGAAPSGRR
jgi:hypothetical protein